MSNVNIAQVANTAKEYTLWSGSYAVDLTGYHLPCDVY